MALDTPSLEDATSRRAAPVLKSYSTANWAMVYIEGKPEQMASNIRTVIEIHVRLLDEGTDVFRPTRAVDLGEGRFEIQATDDYDPELERWEFVPGSIVRTGLRSDGLGQYRVALPDSSPHRE